MMRLDIHFHVSCHLDSRFSNHLCFVIGTESLMARYRIPEFQHIGEMIDPIDRGLRIHIVSLRLMMEMRLLGPGRFR